MDSKTIVTELIRKKLSASRASIRYWIPGTLLLGLILCGGSYFRYTQTGMQPVGWVVGVGIALLIIPLALLGVAFRSRNDKQLLELVNTPERVVWIYQHILRMNGVPQESMMIGDDAGKLYQLPVKRRNGEDPLMDALVDVFPDAVLGFSYELKKLFGKNPQQFRQAVQQHNDRR
ncbi:hypothetical protein ACTJJ0_27305 [Chitinophaga sp. 22321]|uniref:hypothetical protein n=1 Tax=Chitinophaga sp. 22321 TaxID=3453909 RepID=UPI003F832E14